MAVHEIRASADINHIVRVGRNAEYPKQVIYFVVSFIFVVSIWNLFSIIRNYIVIRNAKARNHAKDNEAQRQTGTVGRASVRRLPLAIVSFLRVVVLRKTLPYGFERRITLAEVFIPLFYFAAIITWDFINCDDVGTNNFDIAFLANRSGAIAASQLPFIVALAGKNNIISLLTGISYEKLNVLHRAAARSILVLIWIHLWSRWKLGLTGDDDIHLHYVISGITAATALSFGVLLGNRWIRSRFYEFFLISHHVLTLIVLVCIFVHITANPQFLPYVWPTFFLWGFDRVLRLSRIIYIRYLIVSKARSSEARIRILSSDSLAIEVPIRRTALFGWRAGQFVYLLIPKLSRYPFEAHPFTIASISSPLPETSEAAQGSSSQRKAIEDQDVELKLIVRVREGFTRRLYSYVSQSPSPEDIRLSTLIDGPYGYPPNVNVNSTVILVAGGSGVTYTLPLLLDIVKRARDGATLCRKAIFIWAVREKAHISWIAKELHTAIEANQSDVELDIRIFITGSSPSASVQALNEVTKEKNDVDIVEALLENEEKSGSSSDHETGRGVVKADFLDVQPPVTIESGRPDIGDILTEEITAATGSVSVDVSGPGTLIEDVRTALRNREITGPMSVLKGGANVSLHVETFAIA